VKWEKKQGGYIWDGGFKIQVLRALPFTG